MTQSRRATLQNAKRQESDNSFLKRTLL